MQEDSEEIYITQILSILWSKDDASLENIAYAIAVAQAMLNLKYKKIMMFNTAIKHKIAKNLVSIY